MTEKGASRSFGSNCHQQQNYLVRWENKKTHSIEGKLFIPQAYTTHTHIHHILLCRNKIKGQSQIMNNIRGKKRKILNNRTKDLHLCSIQLPGKLQNTSSVLLENLKRTHCECAKWMYTPTALILILSWGDFTTLHFAEEKNK